MVAVVGGLGAIGAGCLDRPVATFQPLTKTNFSTVVAENSVTQLDILFDIDNSASMGDKQNLLELAIPDLINRLVTPNCVDATGASAGSSTVTNGVASCAAFAGTAPEFNPVQDMHLGIVSSSLGSRGGDICYLNQMSGGGAPFLDGMPAILSHADDQGHLLGRSATSTVNGGTFPTNAETEVQSPVVGAQNFIDWFPPPAAGSNAMATVGTQTLLPAATPETTGAQLEDDFANLVAGVHAFGCGIESQMESWYRFLIQPDPYEYIAPSLNADGSSAPLPPGQTLPTPAPAPGSWVGYDQTIIQQRHDFLRPKSLVAIIVLTDENDSEIDTRSFGGQAWHFMVSGSIATEPNNMTELGAFNPPAGTSQCANTTDPNYATDCTSCAYCNGGAPAAICNDPNCVANPNGYTSPVDWGNDINLRHVHMKQKYGIVPQYPIERYYIGLTSPSVPDRTQEYPAGASFYQGGTPQLNAQGMLVADPGQLNCTNPLFAPENPTTGGTTLPDGSATDPVTLCNAANPPGMLTSRDPNLVFFAHIGGVPHQLLQAQPGVMDPTTMTIPCAAGTAAADCPQKDTLAQSDWVSILGNGAASATPTSPPSYDYTGIDPHMVESYQPRGATVVPTGIAPLTDPGAQVLGGGPDPDNGREWTTNSTYLPMGSTTPSPAHYNLPVDREYACIFPLVNPTTGAPTPRDCSNTADIVNQEACDCSPPYSGPGTFPVAAPSPIPAVCGQCTAAGCSKGGTDYNLQYYAKTYPTIREIELVHLLGQQGILSSLCPIHTSYAGGDTTDPVFGYRPAVNSIINRLKKALTAACLPEPLQPVAGTCTDATGAATAGSCVQCLILVTLPPLVTQTCTAHPGFSDPSAQTKQNFQEQQGDAAIGTTVCQVTQIPYVGTSCQTSTTPGWCYVTVGAGAGCAQSIVFSGSGTTATLPPGSEVSLQCLEGSTTDGGN
jgi:hypothetical protein